MTEEDDTKKAEAKTAAEPDEVEKALARLQGNPESGAGEVTGTTPEESEIPTPSPVIETLPDKAEEMVACQWFMNDMNFCDKIKKNVHCKGVIKNCPF